MTIILSKTDLPFICRICLQKKETMLLIHEEIDIKLMIEACTSVQITDDDYPKMLCEDCRNNFCKFYKFKILCENSNQILYNIIKNNCIYVYKKLNSVQNSLESNPLNSIKLEDNNSSKNEPSNELIDTKSPIALKECEYITDRNCSDNNKKCQKSNNLIVETISYKEELSDLAGVLDEVKTEENVCEQPISVFAANPIVCNICKKIFQNEKQLKRHKYHHSDRKHKCEICGKNFSVKRNLMRHLVIHKPKKEKLPCLYCDKTFEYEVTLKVHHKRYHEGQLKKTLCAVCGKEFINIHTHRKIHLKDPKIKPYKCDKCPKEFQIRKSLINHVQTQHEHNPPPRKELCIICGKSYLSLAHLKIHMVVHTNERLFACEYCEKTFKLKDALKIHTRSHTGFCPYVCTECPKSFKSSTALKRHIRIHSNKRSYVCNICGKGFKQSSTLKTHMKVHS